ncbi:unnamed protein product [Oikopleura dioica]|uniref:Uncharacterized protein n=1 Tax=Oikopleura dioica TaxID=34765 RepID=E4WVL5_OIKDI|nr:unnamed protein product [Oikopleura dioica]
MLNRANNFGLLPLARRNVKVKISDEKGAQVLSNWPKPFGKAPDGPKADWQLGANREAGRVTTFRTKHRWPRPTEITALNTKNADQSISEYTQAPKNIVIEGILSDEEKREPLMLEEFEKPTRPCPLESRKISVTPKDVLILAQFIKKDGTLLSQAQTGLSDRQYEVVKDAVKIAQNDGLLPYSKFSYFENRARWRIQLIDETENPRDWQGAPLSPEIMNRYNCRTRPGLAKALPTKGYPWWRLYVQMGSEKIAEETPVGIPVQRTQKISTSKCQNDIWPSNVPSFHDNQGAHARKMRKGPFNHHQ